MKNMVRTIALVAGILNLTVLGSNTREQLSLTVRLKGQNPTLTVCTSARIAEPFEVVLTNGEAITAISGEIKHPTGQSFFVELAVAQGHGEYWVSDRLGYELKLGVPGKRPVVVTSSNHPNPTLEDREITLADGGCPILGKG